MLLAAWSFSGAALGAATADGELNFNEKFRGIISNTLDKDLVEFAEVEGSSLTVTVTGDSGNGLQPMVELLDASQTPINVGDALKLSHKKAQIKDYVLPASGTYFARISNRNATLGTYKCKVKGKPVKKYVAADTLGVPAEIDEIAFAARAGGTVNGTIKRVSGSFIPAIVELVGPNGNLVSLAGKITVSDGDLTLAKVTLPLLGTYRARITGQGGTTGDYLAKFKVKNPSPVSGTVWEDEHPGNPGPSGPSFTLSEVSFGRGLRTADGLSMDVVSPFSTVLIDPISDLPLEGTLEPLFLGGDLSAWVDFHLGAIYSPPVLPRNAVLVLQFTDYPSLESLELDDDGLLTSESPISITVNGKPVAVEAFVDGKTIVLNPVVGDSIGFPASPVALDGGGNPTANVLGAGKLSLVSVDEDRLESLKGGAYKARSDLLGSPDAGGAAIGFNPGNQILDFFAQSGAGGGNKSFGGFLPDIRSPRLIRQLDFDGNFTPDFGNPPAGDQQGLKTLSLVLAQAFDVVAKGGKGEWSGAVLRLRPDDPTEESHVVDMNSVTSLGGGLYRNDITLESNIIFPLANGQPYQLVRAEFFEPDPNNPIDPSIFDPNNPELVNNTQLVNFVEVRDRNGVLQNVASPVDPLSTFACRFSEAMQVDSFRPYESFFISDNPKADNYGLNYLGVVTSSDKGRVMTFRPDRVIQFGPQAGTREAVGLGKVAKPLLFHMVVVPNADVLSGLLGPTQLQEFLKLGYRGVTDVGGQPLGLPPFSLSAQNPIKDYSFSFSTAADGSLSEWGAVVHRFAGLPQTSFDAEGNTGVTFRDVPSTITTPGVSGSNLYGPRVADVNLFANGFLAGAPVQFFTKIHDDFNPPPINPSTGGHFSAFPFGSSTPIGGYSVLGGARMQHVFRAVEASPDWESLAGTKLDLYHMAYAPIGGFVTNTTLPDFSIHAGHTAIVPDTRQSQGIPSHGSSGLRYTLDQNYDAQEDASGIFHQRQLVAGTETAPGTFQGVAFNIDNSRVFAPIGSDRGYHPIPDEPFDKPFPYNNGVRDRKGFDVTSGSGEGGYYGNADPTWPFDADNPDRRPQSLLIEYRTRVIDVSNPPATSNGFTFAVGVLTSALPRFRAFTYGAGCMACCLSTNAGDCLNSCTISFGPAYNAPRPGAGGPPLDPDLILNAAGPNPAPPGMQCNCLASAQNRIPPPQGCTVDMTTLTPTLDQVAYGSNKPTGINFGDNSRYFMLFNYVKRESFIRSPFVRVQPASLLAATYYAPIFDPPLDDLPEGTTFEILFRSSSVGLSATASPWVTPDDMADPSNPINTAPAAGPFVQFEVVTEGNVSTYIVPLYDEIVVPLKKP